MAGRRAYGGVRALNAGQKGKRLAVESAALLDGHGPVLRESVLAQRF